MKKLAAILLVTVAACTTPEKAEPGVVQVFHLQYQDASNVAKIVAADEKHRIGLSEMAADSRTNSIVAKGSPEDLFRVEKRIRELDVRQH